MNNRSPLPASTPEAQGVSSAAIAAFVDAIHANEIEMHSFELLRHGQRIAEGWWSPYAPEFPHMLFSLSKSFASTAVGLAVAEGRLSVDDPVISFFPEELPGSVSNNLAAMKVRHLLSMSTGHAADATQFLHHAKDGDWVKAFLHSTIDEAPPRPRSRSRTSSTPTARDRPLWADVSAKGRLAGQTDCPRRVGGRGNKQTYRQQPSRQATLAGLGTGLWLPVLALSAWCLSGRRCLWAILCGDARTGCCAGDQQWAEQYADCARPGLGTSFASDGRKCRPPFFW